MKPRIRRVPCVVLLVAQFLAGCTSWHVVDVSPRALVDSAHVMKMQVTETGGAKYVINSPRVVGDSLMWMGRVTLRTPANSTAGEVAYEVPGMQSLPLAAIDRLAVREVSGLKTVLLIGTPILIVGGFAVGLAIYGANAGGPPVCCWEPY